jgi:hypothetical protein
MEETKKGLTAFFEYKMMKPAENVASSSHGPELSITSGSGTYIRQPLEQAVLRIVQSRAISRIHKTTASVVRKSLVIVVVLS